MTCLYVPWPRYQGFGRHRAGFPIDCLLRILNLRLIQAKVALCAYVNSIFANGSQSEAGNHGEQVSNPTQVCRREDATKESSFRSNHESLETKHLVSILQCSDDRIAKKCRATNSRVASLLLLEFTDLSCKDGWLI